MKKNPPCLRPPGSQAVIIQKPFAPYGAMSRGEIIFHPPAWRCAGEGRLTVQAGCAARSPDHDSAPRVPAQNPLPHLRPAGSAGAGLVGSPLRQGGPDRAGAGPWPS